MELYTLNPTREQRDALVENIVSLYRSATPDELRRGKTWYQTAHDIAIIIGGDVKVGAGLLAALSAQRQWAENVRLAYRAVMTDGQIKTLNDQRRKVDAILSGADPTSVLPMESKTGQFYLCILNPTNPHAVVIDRHAHDIARGEFGGDIQRGLSYKKRYDIFADAYRQAAKRINKEDHAPIGATSPATVQAVTWVVWTEKLTNELGVTHRGWSPEIRSSK